MGPVVRRSPISSLGVFAPRDLGRGTPVFSFLEGSEGPLSSLEIKWRFPQSEAPNALQVAPDGFLLLGKPQIYGNHSCEPNAGIDGNLNLVTLRPVRAGEEILWDYSTTMDDDNAWAMPNCQCGSSICRGVVQDFKTLPYKLKKVYCFTGIVPDYCARHVGERGWVSGP